MPKIIRLGTYSSYDESDLRDALIAYRETRLAEFFPFVARDEGLLRRRMIDALLRYKPETEEELRAMLPDRLLGRTDRLQLEIAADEVTTIIQHFQLSKRRRSRLIPRPEAKRGGKRP